MKLVTWWSIESVGYAVHMTRQCGCEMQWASTARVHGEWVAFPCFRHAGVNAEQEAIRHAIVEESRNLYIEW